MKDFDLNAHQLDDSELAAVTGGMPPNYDWMNYDWRDAVISALP
ncbi:bacteriocin [Streptosporangium sp. NPDC002721]